VELASAGAPVTLFESARQLGGRARSVDWQGLAIDNGQHLMVGAYHATLELMRRLGTERLLERRPLDLRLPGFRLALPRLPAPLHLAAGLLRAEGLSWGDKLAAVRFIQGLKQNDFRLARDLPAAEFLRGQPAALVDQLWAPLCIAALNTPLETASAQVFCHVLRDSLMGRRSDSDLIFNRADLGRLAPDAAAAFIDARGGEVRLSQRIEGIRTDCVGLRLAGWDESFANVVIATHPAHAAALTPEFPALEGLRQRLAAFTWQPIATLWLRFEAPPALPFPMLGLGPGQAPWAFERNDLAPGVMAIVESADGPHLRQPAEALKDQYLARLAEAIGPLPPLLDWKLIVEKRATWACTAGLERPDHATAQPGLYLAGDYTAGPYPATLEGAVRSGVECAARILAGRCPS
jgi:squalene-associated FAD-dependent desaturase